MPFVAGSRPVTGRRRRAPRALLLAAAIASLATPAATADPAGSLDAFAWLEGEWIRSTKRGEVVERWTRVSDDTMEGIATISRGTDSAVTEHLRLERLGDGIFYVARPRENPMPTPFLLVAADGTRFTFENPEHDFPQRIVYIRDGETSLRVRIEGMEEGTDGVDFAFVKREEQGRLPVRSAP